MAQYRIGSGGYTPKTYTKTWAEGSRGYTPKTTLTSNTGSSTTTQQVQMKAPEFNYGGGFVTGGVAWTDKELAMLKEAFPEMFED